jgi:hypothetical protein
MSPDNHEHPISKQYNMTKRGITRIYREPLTLKYHASLYGVRNTGTPKG